MSHKHPLTKTALCMAVPLAALPAGEAPAPANTQGKTPNIIHIMADDHAFQAISAYGHPISKLAPTPNIDRLAREGMLFRRAYVENSLCAPSRACLLTGLYSHQNGQRRLGGGIDVTKPFFVETLQARGYQTGIVGKWHLDCEPKGFDYYRLLEDQGEYYNPRFKTKDTGGKYVREEGYATVLTVDHSIEFLKNRDKARPFCLMVHHKAPHRNWMPEEKYLNLYEDTDFPLPGNFFDDGDGRCEAARTQEMTIATHMTMVYDLKMDSLRRVPPYDKEWNVRGWDRDKARLTKAQRAAWDKAYAARQADFASKKPEGRKLAEWKYQYYLRDYLRCIKSIDEQVGRLLAYLDAEGLRENTIVVYTSDQGFYLGEHGWFDKRFMYEESFRTPLIMSWPGKIAAGAECDALVQNIDFAATYLAVAGAKEAGELPGRSLEPLFKQGKAPAGWREYLYYHYYDYPAIHQVRRHDGVSDGRYKYIHFYGKSRNDGTVLDCNELYDLANDSGEMTNLAGNPQYKEITRRLQNALDDFRRKLGVDEY